MKFKVGDRVKRVVPSRWPEQYGKLGEIYTVLESDGSGGIVVIPNKGITVERYFKLEEEILYEDNWNLVDKSFIESGEKIQEDAKTLKDDSGDTVAFKRVKKPIEKFFARYLSVYNDGWGTYKHEMESTHKITLKVVDGEPVSAEIVKL